MESSKEQKILSKNEEMQTTTAARLKEMKQGVEQVEQYANPTESLMPELEELVKKNPNRLIGCGG